MDDQISEEERTTARGLARYAYEYIEAARLVDQHHEVRNGNESVSPIPAYFLVIHGIELTLKAYLRHHLVTPRELSRKQYGHDLRACYRKAKELGLRECFKMHSNDMRAMLMLIELNKNHELRYIRTGSKHFPSWAIVEPFAVRLHQAVAPLVSYRSFDVKFGGYE
jgi:hypothetical protein